MPDDEGPGPATHGSGRTGSKDPVGIAGFIPKMPPLPETSPPETASPRKSEPFFYGGQAVIEGVMMRGKRHYAVAVRLPTTKEILVDKGELKASIYVKPIWKFPFIRGLALLGEQLHLGMKSLIWSANMNAGANNVTIGKREITGSVAVAGVFALAIFIGIPLLAAWLAVPRVTSFWFVVVEGIVRVALVLGYLSLIALLPDVRRVFQYHGAEHKTINAYESGWPLEVPSVRRASLLHPRCGTGFLLVVLVVSIVVFSVVAIFHPNLFWLVASRIIAIPVIAGAGFELIRFMARNRRNPVIKVLLLPVLGTQKFTTREPSDDMLEVAIAAFNAAREGEEDTAGAAA